MIFAKPLFAGLASKAGNFLLSKAKGFLSRNLPTIKRGAISFLTNGGNLEDTIKKTAGNIISNQKSNLTSYIQKGTNKLKKIIDKKGQFYKNKYMGVPKTQKNMKKRIRQPIQDSGQQENNQIGGNYMVPNMLRAPPMMQNLIPYTREEDYSGIQKLYADSDQIKQSNDDVNDSE